MEKVRPIVNNDECLVKLIWSFCNNQILDNSGQDLSTNNGIPLMGVISQVLFNIMIDDIDQKMEERFPNQKYARYEHEIFIPIHYNEDEMVYYTELHNIFNECNFIAPEIECAIRGGEPVTFSGGFISVNNEGKSKWLRVEVSNKND
jgi:retron-type reverse transcriptase